jgi:hypothetical protein
MMRLRIYLYRYTYCSLVDRLQRNFQLLLPVLVLRLHHSFSFLPFPDIVGLLLMFLQFSRVNIFPCLALLLHPQDIHITIE